MKQQKLLSHTLQLSLLLLTASTLVGCGKSSPAPAPETPPAEGAPPPTQSTTKPLAWCNQGNSNSYQLNLKAFVDSTKKVRPDWAIGKVLHLPSTFATDESFVSFYRWKMNGSGASSIDTTPLVTQVQNASTKQVIVPGVYKLSWSDVKTAANGMSPTDFFNTTRLIFNTRDTAGEYQAIKMVIYNKSGTVAEQIDMLLPLFYADPADYSLDLGEASPSSVLVDLHPFDDLKNQGITGAQYKAMSEGFCF